MNYIIIYTLLGRIKHFHLKPFIQWLVCGNNVDLEAEERSNNKVTWKAAACGRYIIMVGVKTQQFNLMLIYYCYMSMLNVDIDF